MKKLFNEIEYFFINVDLFVFAMVAAMVVVLVVCIVIGVNTCSVEKVTVVDVEELGSEYNHPLAPMAVVNFANKNYAMAFTQASVRTEKTVYKVTFECNGERFTEETSTIYEVGESFFKIVSLKKGSGGC